MHKKNKKIKKSLATVHRVLEKTCALCHDKKIHL